LDIRVELVVQVARLILLQLYLIQYFLISGRLEAVSKRPGTYSLCRETLRSKLPKRAVLNYPNCNIVVITSIERFLHVRN
jgi:hypothetical protein